MGDPVLRLVEPVNTAAPDVLAATVEALVPGELRACGGGAGGLDAFFAAWRLGQADGVGVNRDRLEAEPLPIVLVETVSMLPTPHVLAVARAAALGSKDRERTGLSLQRRDHSGDGCRLRLPLLGHQWTDLASEDGSGLLQEQDIALQPIARLGQAEATDLLQSLQREKCETRSEATIGGARTVGEGTTRCAVKAGGLLSLGGGLAPQAAQNRLQDLLVGRHVVHDRTLGLRADRYSDLGDQGDEEVGGLQSCSSSTASSSVGAALSASPAWSRR